MDNIKPGHANYRLSPEGIFVKTHLCAESRQVSHSRVQHHNHQMTKSKSTCSLGTSTVSASAQQNTAQWDKFVDFNNRFLNGFSKGGFFSVSAIRFSKLPKNR